MAKQHKTLLGFIAGLALGVGIYVFLKSERGEELLTNLKQKADDLRDEFDDLVAKGRDAASDLIAKGEEEYKNENT